MIYRELALNDRANRTLTFANTAVDASVSINYVLGIALGNSVHGTSGSAGTAADAGIVNNTCHDSISFPVVSIN